MNTRRNARRFLCALAASVLALSSARFFPALAERLESNSFVIQFSNFNMTSGRKDSSSYSVSDTVGQTGTGAYSSTTYRLGGGFQYIYQINRFAFSLSRVAIDFGTLTPNVHGTASHTITITTRGAGGYSVYAFEQHPLRHSAGSYTIPDTTCNAGTCSEIAAGVWSDQTKPGFGFNMTGNDVPADFTDSTYFRQFADVSNSETMRTVMSSSNIADARQATVTYKTGITGNQAAGNYQTGVVYVAVPGY